MGTSIYSMRNFARIAKRYFADAWTDRPQDHLQGNKDSFKNIANSALENMFDEVHDATDAFDIIEPADEEEKPIFKYIKPFSEMIEYIDDADNYPRLVLSDHKVVPDEVCEFATKCLTSKPETSLALYRMCRQPKALETGIVISDPCVATVKELFKRGCKLCQRSQLIPALGLSLYLYCLTKTDSKYHMQQALEDLGRDLDTVAQIKSNWEVADDLVAGYLAHPSRLH